MKNFFRKIPPHPLVRTLQEYWPETGETIQNILQVCCSDCPVTIDFFRNIL